MVTVSHLTVILIAEKMRKESDKTGVDTQLYDSRAASVQLLDGLKALGTVKRALLYASLDTDLVICDLEVTGPNRDYRAADILPNRPYEAGIHCRVYQSLQVSITPKVVELKSRIPHIAVTNAMTPARGQEDDFNDWYNEEHLSLLSQSPLWLSSRRYLLLSATDEAPQYLAIHAWEGHEAFESQEYKYAINTEWKHKVVGQVLRRDREVYSFVEEIR